jgi:hypothetical protein
VRLIGPDPSAKAARQATREGQNASVMGWNATWAQDSLWQPENDGCSDADGGHECVGASIATGVDAAPVLELSEHVLDLVTLAVEGGVERDGHFAVRF